MRLTCGTCGDEIVGAYRITGVDLEQYAFVWTSQPAIINAHNTACEAT